jgi:Leucine-rich repeat (LRR) protein
MVFNATFNNISAISWRSVLLVEETRVTKENHRPAAIHNNIIKKSNKLKRIYII